MSCVHYTELIARSDFRKELATVIYLWNNIHTAVAEGDSQGDRLLECVYELNVKSNFDQTLRKLARLYPLDLWKEFPREMQYAIWELITYWRSEVRLTTPSYLWFVGLPGSL